MLPPRYRVVSRDGEKAVVAFELPPDLMYFRGHFPARALLPGVAQLDFAISLCDEIFGSGTGFNHVVRLKFVKPILPGDGVELVLRYSAQKRQLDFSYAISARRGLPLPPVPVTAGSGRLRIA